MKKNWLKILAVVFLILIAATFAACGPADDGENPGGGPGIDKEVSKIEMEELPTKTTYFIDDIFDPTGGKIKVTYIDGTSEILFLIADGVTIGAVNTERIGDKTVTVNYGGQRTTFKVTVQLRGFTVTFNYNYESAPAPTEKNVSKGMTATKPSAPLRSGFSFYDWYIDETCTYPYDFENAIMEDITLFAEWKDTSKTYYEFTYDLNYYGVKPVSFKQIVQSGQKARSLAVSPERGEYRFDGWFNDAVGASAFNSNTAIQSNTTVYADWTKTKTGPSTYVFEAENTDMTGKVGPGYSGSAQEKGMIGTDPGFEASNGKYITFLYERGLSLEFRLACGEATTVTLVVRMTAEINNVSVASDNYLVKVNGISQSYAPVVLSEELASNQKVPFKDAVSITVALKKGENLIQLVTNSTEKPEEGGTLLAKAPMIDCIKVSTNAVVTWDGNYNLPKNY